MNPTRHLQHHPLAGVRLIILYVGFVIALAVIATVIQNSA